MKYQNSFYKGAIIIFFMLVSCSQQEQPIQKPELANDSFRAVCMPEITDPKDIKMFDTLLNALDKKQVSFCELNQNLLRLDDSCYDVAKRLYPNPDDQEKSKKIHSKAIREAQTRYLNSFGLRDDYATFATINFYFYPNIQTFCKN